MNTCLKDAAHRSVLCPSGLFFSLLLQVGQNTAGFPDFFCSTGQRFECQDLAGLRVFKNSLFGVDFYFVPFFEHTADPRADNRVQAEPDAVPEVYPGHRLAQDIFDAEDFDDFGCLFTA